MSQNTVQLHSISQSMTVAISWQMQFLAVLSIVSFFTGLIFWNYFMLPEPSLCREDPFPAWTKDFTFLIVGATSGTTIQLWFRTIVSMNGFSSERLRHPYATWLIIFISTTQAIAQVVHQTGVIDFTCVDFLGVKSPFVLWWEWCSTVPFMFFLVSIMDVKRNCVTKTDLWIELLGGSAIFTLFFCILPLPRMLCWIFFFYSNVAMTAALAWQQYIAYDEYSLAQDEVAAHKAKNPDMDFIPRKIYDQLKVSQCKMNASIFLSLFFTLFPLWYYLKFFEYIDEGVFIVLTYGCSYLSKVLFLQIIGDSHVEILDPNKFLLVEERKKAEEARLMFLRYVFHEVRVPLNSISLGLQLIEDSPHLSDQDLEMVNMMKEATTFMSETLNDVLSLQKMEQGMLELEVKPFVPSELVQSVLNNFRAQCEAKHIKIDCIISSDVPPKILGDQFRLEHVLGNLLSNAIKFSDPNSLIQIRVSYNTEAKNYVTFSVTDEGPGMSEDEQKLLFQPFMQIRPGELQKGRGSGLGLSICKNIIELHHGQIGCRSKERVGNDRSTGGSTFYFSLEFFADRVENRLRDAAGDAATPKVVLAPTAKGSSASSSGAPLSHHSATASAVLSTAASEIGSAIKKERSLHTADFVAMRSLGRKGSSSAQEMLQQLRSNSRSQPSSPKATRTSSRRQGPARTGPESDSSSSDSTAFARSNVNNNNGSYITRNSGRNSGEFVRHTRSSSKNRQIQDQPDLSSSDEPLISITNLDVEFTSPSGDEKSSQHDVDTAVSASRTNQKDTSAMQHRNSTNDDSNKEESRDISLRRPVLSVSNQSLLANVNTPFSSEESTPNPSKFKILIVDDVLSNRKMLDMTLKRKGYSCDQAVDGSEAVDLIHRKGIDYYDIIFMDSVMPIMCGPDAAKKLRALGYSKLLIGVTGNAMDVDIADFEAAGADAILTKPMRVEALVKVLDFCHEKGCVSHFNRFAPVANEDRLKTWIQKQEK